jgi:hypothetical protein
MTDNASGSGFTIRPEAVPQLRTAFQDASEQLRSALADVQGLRITQPAMADEASIEFQAAFNAAAGEGPGSAAESLKAFEQRLAAVLAQLGAIQQAYDSNERDTAAQLSGQLDS